MPRPKLILASLCLAAAGALASGCGGGDEPEPSIPLDSATTLVSTLEEIQANVDAGSCIVASTKVQEFQTELSELPSDVNQEVVDALQRGGLNLGDLIDEQCDQPEETTTEETTTQETTTTAPPTTTTTPPPNTGGGGVGPPGGGDGL